MYRRKDDQPKLVVKEVILPKKDAETPSTSQASYQRDLKVLRNEDTEENDKGGSFGGGLEANNLLILKKEPLEDYFQGTRQKKQHKKKVRPKKINQSLSEFNLFGSQSTSVEESRKEEPSSSSGRVPDKLIWECLTRERNIQRKKLRYRLQMAENMIEWEDKDAEARQKMREKLYLEEQESLFSIWRDFVNKQNEKKKLTTGERDRRHNYRDYRPKRGSYYRQAKDDYYRDGGRYVPGTGQEAEEKPKEEKTDTMSRAHSVPDYLSESFQKKLGFVDDEDGD